MPDILSDFYQILNFSRDFREYSQYQISGKSVKWEARWNMRIYRQAETKERLKILTPLKELVSIFS